MWDNYKLQLQKNNQVNFWKDAWLIGYCLVDSHPALFHISSLKAGLGCQDGELDKGCVAMTFVLDKTL